MIAITAKTDSFEWSLFVPIHKFLFLEQKINLRLNPLIQPDDSIQTYSTYYQIVGPKLHFGNTGTKLAQLAWSPWRWDQC